MEKLLEIYTKKKNNLFQNILWEQVYKTEGFKTWLITFDNDDALVVKLPLRGKKSYLYVPRGPHFTTENWHLFVKRCQKIAKEEKAVFLRVEPLKIPNGTVKKLNFRTLKKYSPLSKQHSPVDTLLLNLDKSKEELLVEMKPKGRYNIKVAERSKIKIRKSQKESDLKEFYRLSTGMIERGYHSFDYQHYLAIFESLTKTKNVCLFVAEKDKEILSIIMIIFYQDLAIYLHGASSDQKRELMPNHLAQWEAIKEAKKKGCKLYDFWGIAPSDQDNHPWAGITRFKKSFGGNEVHLLGVYDLPLDKMWYNLFCFLNVIRKIIKR